MNSAFLNYLVNGNKSSTEGLIYLEGTFQERIPPLTIYSCSKVPMFREITLSASKDALTLVNDGKPESDFKWEGIVGATNTSIPASDFPTLTPCEHNSPKCSLKFLTTIQVTLKIFLSEIFGISILIYLVLNIKK